MFSLRNRGTEEAVLALCEGFNDQNALFRHEIAYVLGQMQHQASVPALTKVLHNEVEHRMVRHEAAEALGAVGGDKVEGVLKVCSSVLFAALLPRDLFFVPAFFFAIFIFLPE